MRRAAVTLVLEMVRHGRLEDDDAGRLLAQFGVGDDPAPWFDALRQGRTTPAAVAARLLGASERGSLLMVVVTRAGAAPTTVRLPLGLVRAALRAVRPFPGDRVSVLGITLDADTAARLLEDAVAVGPLLTVDDGADRIEVRIE